MKLQGTAVLVLPDKNPDKLKSGVVIPRTAKNLRTEGKVIDIGPGCKNHLKIGDHIQYNLGGVSLIEIEGVTHHFINENRINYIYD